ncbi:sulfite exporter TauE/SafE family protein [Rhizobacter sp. AJA081-3]|uniref:urease accessory protein UreH domain-containing protein n=1 Tax=Rhizobacter sp. AJA081-3 TaxID=2753607 RepID=UPI001ADF576D|nr:sulfite exporter TauE/SafE family protein [Rhizobacter sp. AJA081-3]QTN25159.1 sulfite exporter TauE/SafE family protein [Rhizobacter sp. AJA081-3]
MNTALAATALLMGLAGAPHCAAMCGAACAGIVRSCHGAAGHASSVAFHFTRLAGYAAGGALAAGSVSWLATQGAQVALLRPLWTLFQVAALALGLWLLIAGRQPGWVDNFRVRATSAAQTGRQVIWLQGPAGAAAAGSMWVALPCGLLQSALVVSALGSGPLDGAVLMALFAAGSSLGLLLGPSLWLSLAGRHAGQAQVWSVRLAGLMLAGASAWALAHGLATAMGSDFCLPF